MATKQVTMTDLMLELSYLLGEVTVPTSGVDGRKVFLQRSLEDAWKAYPWPFSLTDTTITFSNGVATFPDDFLPEGHYYITNGSGVELNEVDYGARGTTTGAAYYTRFSDGEYQAVLLNEQDFTGELRYQYVAPDLTTSDTKKAVYPNPATLATGALRYVVKADNPEADNSQEEGTFVSRLQEDYSPFNRNRTRNRRARSLAEVAGHNAGVN